MTPTQSIAGSCPGACCWCMIMIAALSNATHPADDNVQHRPDLALAVRQQQNVVHQRRRPAPYISSPSSQAAHPQLLGEHASVRRERKKTRGESTLPSKSPVPSRSPQWWAMLTWTGVSRTSVIQVLATAPTTPPPRSPSLADSHSVLVNPRPRSAGMIHIGSSRTARSTEMPSAR